MANLNFIEKNLLENEFSMKNGYVLDFSNRTFSDFIDECLGINVYSIYPQQSKANLLRAVFKDQTDSQVGKLINQLLRYKKEIVGLKQDEVDNFNRCVDISNRLLGKVNNSKIEKKDKKELTEYNFDEIKSKLFEVLSIEQPNLRGYAFEKFLNYFFEIFSLNPRSSYKIQGEQIDGSFIYNNCTYILEAKWKKEEIGVDDLRIFSDKISSKSAFTRGLFISFSNFNNYIFQKYNNNQARFILVTVQEIFIMLERKIAFLDLLSRKIRVLEEEGLVFKNIMDLN